MNTAMDARQFDSFDWEKTADQLENMSGTTNLNNEAVDHVDGHLDGHFDGHFDGTKTLDAPSS